MGDIKAIEPTATTNLCTQPSFEGAITAWATAGTNTIAKSSAQSYKGNYSLLCTYADELSLASYAVTLPTISVTYKLTARLYVSSNWDGGNISLSSVDYAGATNTGVSQYTHGTSTTETWLKLETTLALSTDAIGSVILVAASAPTAGRFVYLDAVQIEKQSTATTYTDGDQPGGTWDGEPHNSTTTRDARAWQGGIIRDLADDYFYKTSQYPGAGLTSIQNNAQEYAMLKGAFYQNAKRFGRRWALAGHIKGESTTFHPRRAALVNLFNPSRYGGSDPVVLRYTGTTTEKDIFAYYDGGLDYTEVAGFNEFTPIRLYSPDPDFYGDRDNSTAISVFDSATFQTVAAKIDGAWSALGPPNASGTYTTVYAIAYFNAENIYFAGNFENFDNIATADFIVKYNSVTGLWSSITTSGAADLPVHALAVDPAGNLYAGGLFSTINGVAAANIAKYVPSTGVWSALSTGMNGTVWRLRWFEGLLYAVGEFTTAGGTTVNRVTSWNGSGFTAFGGGTKGVAGGAAYDIAIIQNEGLNDMYVVGAFTTAGGSAAVAIAKFTAATSTWSAIGAGLTGSGGEGRVLLVLPNGDLIVGGSFTAAGGVTAGNIARYNGRAFFALGSSVAGGNVYSLAYNTASGRLTIGGSFTSAGGSSVGDRVTFWNGSKYFPVDIDLPSTPDVWDIVDTGSDLYLGFSTTGTGYYSNPTTVNNAGTEPANPIIKISRSGGTLARIETIENTTSGKRIYLNRSLQDGETLVIDTRVNGRGVYSEFSGGIAGSEIQPAAVQPGSDLKTFTILPGDNIIQCYAATADTPTITAFCMFRDCFGSLDG